MAKHCSGCLNMMTLYSNARLQESAGGQHSTQKAEKNNVGTRKFNMAFVSEQIKTENLVKK